MKRKNNLILEFTEFNLQRMSPDSAVGAVGGVDDPSLSTNARWEPGRARRANGTTGRRDARIGPTRTMRIRDALNGPTQTMRNQDALDGPTRTMRSGNAHGRWRLG
jgi:hypothetical protein